MVWWHAHWVVLVENAFCAPGGTVKQFDPSDTT